ncbi:uncharacterized protein TNCV_3665621 [Trichonephila clavipes]|nr:uncharacterized protein TNCV_3665621 [Trichonephila clavipes]
MSKGIKLSDGKNISGRGRLTLKEVDSIQHYYGLAIRKHLSSVEDMKRAIWAIYFHKLSTEDNPQHALCPLGEDSCSWVAGIMYLRLRVRPRPKSMDFPDAENQQPPFHMAILQEKDPLRVRLA